MNLTQDTQSSQYYDFNSHIIDMVGQILQQKFLKVEIGDFDVGNLVVENHNEPTNSFFYKCRTDGMNHANPDTEQIWLAYFDFFFPPEDLVPLMPELFHAIRQKELNKVYFFFQRARPQHTGDYKWYFATSKLFALGDESQPGILFRYAFELNKAENKPLSLNDESYFQKYCNRVMLLSKREKEVIKLIVEGKSSHDISELLFISIHTVNNHRKNITNKLEINNLCHLTKFAILFNMV
ncbi:MULTISPECIES: response regulator transcription factor [Sphingobacterium]|uniref:response regulator transcription factor n=1 Tax=Sphingobacterium TaxID=28453 RepID=UPI0038FC2750